MDSTTIEAQAARLELELRADLWLRGSEAFAAKHPENEAAQQDAREAREFVESLQ